MCTSANQIFLVVFLKYKINTNAAVWSLKSTLLFVFLASVVLIAGFAMQVFSAFGFVHKITTFEKTAGYQV